ncbi:hypothetical protein R3Q06_23790 [Rhodococcus erythropolis]|uniref:hypothetical protein n=1 Tax=Rhodococcus erythropolis TaxID=1833 RepID=UPI002949CCD5|nr:hypothetical protein [Rhodococcus erythropolis]MDV6276526.1 hypothetical protein [Rhodococcus erythropolis]
MRWSILDGCDDPEVAKRRAEALVQAMPMDDTSNAGYWNGKAAMLMRGYLYTAAVKNKDLMDLRIWASSRNVKLVRDALKKGSAGLARRTRPGVGLEVRLFRRRGQRMCTVARAVGVPEIDGRNQRPSQRIR